MRAGSSEFGGVGAGAEAGEVAALYGRSMIVADVIPAGGLGKELDEVGLVDVRSGMDGVKMLLVGLEIIDEEVAEGDEMLLLLVRWALKREMDGG